RHCQSFSRIQSKLGIVTIFQIYICVAIFLFWIFFRFLKMTSTPIKIGIIGGTGLDQDASILTDRQMVPVPETPYGSPSDPEVVHGKIDGVDVYLLGRHGRAHDVSPTHVNYRANLWTFRQLGVTHILATTACGSL